MTTDTLMQAASISKPLCAVAALQWVEQGRLSLDADINPSLRSWQVQPGAQTADKPVTLRRLLSHSAGFTVSGFEGYAVGAAMPSLLQVLDGLPPSNSAAIGLMCRPAASGARPAGAMPCCSNCPRTPRASLLRR